MELWIGQDIEYFGAHARDFLAARIERNVLATVLSAVVSGRYRKAVLAVISDQQADTVAVAIRTPPHLMLAAGEISDPDTFITAWRQVDPHVPGVSAQTDLARALAQAWTRVTASTTTLRAQEALHVLEQLTPPESVPGALRLADFRDNAQLGEWGVAFAVESGLGNSEAAPAAIQHSVRHGRLHVWQRNGANLAMVGHNEVVAGTVRIGPVYTPPQQRGRGYATAGTAAVSQLLLDQGVERCMLYTDLANPISNHIYAKLGYRPIADWEEHGFH